MEYKRTGQNYSLNGFGAIIGKMSGMILDYSTCNRKYKICDANVEAPDHDCRKNFDDSAKALELYVKKLVVEPYLSLRMLRLVS